MSEKLYFIENQGCDATTYGIARISDEDFPKFKTIIENLNKNSTYGCMPRIAVYKADMEQLKEIVYNPNADFGEEGYCCSTDYIFYLDGKTYTFAGDYFSYYSDWECVIKND